jgi:hypothetical protein
LVSTCSKKSRGRCQLASSYFNRAGHSGFFWNFGSVFWFSKTSVFQILETDRFSRRFKTNKFGFGFLLRFFGKNRIPNLRPVWCGASGATARLSRGGRIGRHTCGVKTTARRGGLGHAPNNPLYSIRIHDNILHIILKSKNYIDINISKYIIHHIQISE